MSCVSTSYSDSGVVQCACSSRSLRRCSSAPHLPVTFHARVQLTPVSPWFRRCSPLQRRTTALHKCQSEGALVLWRSPPASCTQAPALPQSWAFLGHKRRSLAAHGILDSYRKDLKTAESPAGQRQASGSTREDTSAEEDTPCPVECVTELTSSKPCFPFVCPGLYLFGELPWPPSRSHLLSTTGPS